MFHSLPSIISTGVFVLVALAAAARGRLQHRVVAGVIALTWLVSGLVQDRTHWQSPQWAIFAIDAAVALAVTAAAMRWGRIWLLACAAFTWLQLMTHVAMVVDTRLHARAYLTALGLWSMAQVAALAWGVWGAWRDRVRERRAAP